MKLKVCGMKYNTAEVAKLQPDYLGFIFYEKSPRHFEGEIHELPDNIKKVGVFVDEDIETVVSLIQKHELDAVQLHGHETSDYCEKLRQACHSERSEGSQNKILKQHFDKLSVTVQHDNAIEIIKVFSIKDKFDFSVMEPYEDVCDYFLFDTKGKLPGGNGYTFNWDVLKNYPSKKPFFLSGGIGLEEVDSILSFLRRQESKYCHALDVNSKFEIEPGLKDIDTLEQFINKLKIKTT